MKRRNKIAIGAFATIAAALLCQRLDCECAYLSPVDWEVYVGPTEGAYGIGFGMSYWSYKTGGPLLGLHTRDSRWEF